MADTIREFLIGFGFKLDEAGERRFVSMIEGATLRANLLADAVEAMARVVVDKVDQVSKEFENLYYQSQKIGASANSIKAFEFAVSQFGGTVEGANASLEGFADYLRHAPGAIGALAKQLGIPLKDTADRGLFLLEVSEKLKNMALTNPTLANQYREFYHVGDYDTIAAAGRAGARNAYLKDLRGRESAGIGGEKALEEAARLRRAVRQLAETDNIYFSQLISGLDGVLANGVEKVNKYLDDHKKKISEFVDWLGQLGFLSEAAGKTSIHFDEKKFGEHFEKALSAAETATVTQLKHLDDALHPVVEWFERFGRVLSGWFTQPHLNPDGTPELLGGGGSSGGGGGIWGRVKRFFGVGGGAGGGSSSGTDVTPPGPAGTYRPRYNLSERDLSEAVINTVAGEAQNNPQSIDAVLNNMFNRLGTHTYGPSGNLEEVARAPGQYTGYTRPSAQEAELIRSRIRAIAAGQLPDNTGGSNEYRASWYAGPWGWNHPEGRVVGGNKFAFNPRGGIGPYAAFATPHDASPPGLPSAPTPGPPLSANGVGQPLSWDQGPAWNNLNASLPVGGATTNDNSKAITSSVTNNVTVNAPDPHSAAAMVGLHLDRSANDLARNLQGAHQ